MEKKTTGADINRRIQEEKILLEGLLALLDDGSVLLDVDNTYDSYELLQRVSREGFGFVSKVLPRFYKHILRCLENRLFTPFAGFRKQRGGRGLLPAFLHGWTSVLFNALDGSVNRPVSFADKERWREAHCFLSTFCQGFGSKYEFAPSEDLHDKQVQGAIDLEDSIFDEGMLAQAALDENLPVWVPSVSDYITAGANPQIKRQNGPNYPVTRRDIAIQVCTSDGGNKWSRIDKEVTRLLDRLFSGFDPLDILPCHGPGSVYEKSVKFPHEKYNFNLASSTFCDLYPYHTYFRPSLDTRLEPLESGLIDDRDLLIERYAREIGGISRHRLVPKNAEKGRDINLEGTALMYLQKGLQKKLYAYLESHPMLQATLPNGRRVCTIGFTDQTVNQYWALEASKTREKATLDMKSASSFVGLAHVDRYMPKHMREALLALRSTYVEYAFKKKSSAGRFAKPRRRPIRVLKTRTYAPMGSAVCFPVEAVVFWAFSQSALHYMGCNEPVFVYGDDLVVPTRHAKFIVQVLNHFGFVVNVNKSFFTGYFRESCGVDAYLGMNVSPVVRVKKPVPLIRDTAKPKSEKDALSISSEGAAGLVAWLKYSNELYAHNYTSCAELIRKVLKRNFPKIWKYIPRACDLSGQENHLGILDYTAPRLSNKKISTPEPRFRPRKPVSVGPPQCPIFEYISWTERRPPFYQDQMIRKALYVKTPTFTPKNFDESRRYMRWVCEKGEDTSIFTLRKTVQLKLGPRYSS